MKKFSLFIAGLIVAMTTLPACNTSASTTPGSSPTPAVETVTPPTTAPKQAQTTEMEVVEMNAAEFKKVVDEGSATLIDVRTEREYASGHIEGTDMNLSTRNPNFKTELNKLDKDQPYMIYCHSGGRSKATLRLMKSMGFTKVYHLTRGVLDWRSAALPLVK